MLAHMVLRRRKKDPAERAAEIIARHNAKIERNSGIFTELQEKKRQELGLHPTLRPEPTEPPVKGIRDPLSKRQRALLDELGLNPKFPKD